MLFEISSSSVLLAGEGGETMMECSADNVSTLEPDSSLRANLWVCVRTFMLSGRLPVCLWIKEGENQSGLVSG